MSKPLKIFITYSHKDKAAKNELIMRLDVMKKQDMIKIWHDNEILPGDKWYEDISNNLADSDILLYLVSASSLASENCNKELGEALDVDKKVIPIILEDCDWQKHQLGAIEALPDKGKPINEWQPESKGWQNVVDGIRKVVGEMQTQAFDSAHQGALPEWIFQQGNFLMMIGQIDKAIEAYSHVIELTPHMVTAYNNRGVAYSEKGENDCAIEDLNKAIALNPNDAKAYNNRGVAYSEKGEIDRAIEDLSKAIELNPNNSKAYNNRGLAYSEKGEIDRAIEDLNKAIGLNPNDAEAYNNRGLVYGRTGKIDRAIEDLKKAIRLNPKNAEAYNHRGNAYSDIGAYDLAIADYNKAIELNPDYTEAYNNRAIAHSDTGAYDRAITDYSKAIELDPNDADIYNNRGVAYKKKGEMNCAIEDCNKAIKLNPEFALAYYNRGEAWLHLRNWNNARSDLTIAKYMGVDIISIFRELHNNVVEFERKYAVKLPEDIAAMLTQG